MTETAETPALAANGGTPKLNAAIARVQAEIPAVAKGETGTVEKDGRPLYSYRYADLATCTAAILPLLGRNGLAFIGLPGIGPDGKFGLAYELAHESGESRTGWWPLPSSGTPQQVGSALTYARRYCLCTATGLAPGGDDDDARAGNSHQQYDRAQSAGQAFDSAVPAAPGNRPAAARPATVEAVPLEPDDPWHDAIGDITDRDEATRLYEQVAQQRRDGQIDDARASRLGALITAKVTNLQMAAKAETRETADAGAQARPDPPTTPAAVAANDAGTASSTATAADSRSAPEQHPPATSTAGGWVDDWRARLAAAGEDKLAGLQREVGSAIRSRKITAQAGGELSDEIRARRAELTAVPA